jgi:hypothetical protein
VPRTILQNGANTHLYDQIAWFTTPQGQLPAELPDLHRTHAGGFGFLPDTYPGMTRTEVSWRISDHYPLWADSTPTTPRTADPHH